ncbi:MAG: hypothetical protein ACTSQJ_09120 [Promethearchaeota archaeon]
MIQENEIIVFIIGIGTLIFIFINRLKINHIPESRIFVLAFVSFLIGWFFTILEGFLFGDLLNFIEHLCFAIGSILITIWISKVFKRRRDTNESCEYF